MKSSGIIITRLGDKEEEDIIFCPGCGKENICEDIVISSNFTYVDFSCFGIFKYIYKWNRLKCTNCQSIFIKYDVERVVRKKAIDTIIFLILTITVIVGTVIYGKQNSEIFYQNPPFKDVLIFSCLFVGSLVNIVFSFIAICSNLVMKIFRGKPEDLLR